MSKEKRTYNSEVLDTTSLKLQKVMPAQNPQSDLCSQEDTLKQKFAPELINRLAEKIKKL
jgi:hypothetical protein